MIRTTLRRFLRGGLAAALASTAFLAACDAPGESLLTPVDQSLRSGTGEEADPGQKLARAFALAMRDPSVRVQVRNALRDSPMNEHKLVLQEFVKTRAGRNLVEEAAAAAGVGPNVVMGWIGALPAMDFYVPLREHRQTWRGSDDVVVGLNLNVDDPRLTGFTPADAVVSLDARNGTPTQTVLLLHPAEPKWQRSAAELASGGETIEPRSSSTGPGMYIAPDCSDPECATSGGGSIGPVLSGYRAYIGDGWGDNEILFKHYTVDYLKNYTKVWEWAHSGYSEYEWATANKSTVLGDRVVKVWERDSGFPEGSSDSEYLGEATMAPSGSLTYFKTSCGSVYSEELRIWFGQTCAYGGPEAYHTQILTIEVLYKY